MKIWLVDTHPGDYMKLQFEKLEDRKQYAWSFCDGVSHASNWVPLQMENIGSEQPSDCVGSIKGGLFVSEAVVEALKDMQQGQIEFLPIHYAGKIYYILNVLHVLDCVDGANSRSVGDLHSDYRDMAFFEDRIGEAPLFKVVHHSTKKVCCHRLFASEAFKQRVEALGLVGFQFAEAWDSANDWQKKAAHYDAIVQAVNDTLYDPLDFKHAIQRVEQEKITVYSGKFALKHNERKELILGTLQVDGSYEWVNVFYIPLHLVGLQWGIKREPKSFFVRLLDRIALRF